MKYPKFVPTLTAWVVALGCLGQETSCKAATQHSPDWPKAVPTESSLQPILRVLAKAKISGSLEFSGDCENFGFPGFPEFPQVLSTPATISGTPLQALRRIFEDDPAMRVKQEADGTIRMVEKGAPKDILNVKIHRLNFARATYDSNVAAEYVKSAPEVMLFMKSHDVAWAFVGGPVSFMVAEPSSGGEKSSPAPHISGSIDNVTVSGAMDRILKIFPGLWIYESCPRTDKRERIIHFEFYGYDQIQQSGR